MDRRFPEPEQPRYTDMPQNGYSGASYTRNYTVASFEQENGVLSHSPSPTAHQRLVLSLVSIILLLVAFGAVVVTMALIPSQFVIPISGGGGLITATIKDNSAWQHMIGILLIVALLIFGVLVLGINILFGSFYRKQGNHKI